MKELIKHLKENCTLVISAASEELEDYIKLNMIDCRNYREPNLAVFVLLLQENCEFKITTSNKYTTQDHRFWGTKIAFPCTTVFIHSTYKDLNENMRKLNAMLES